MPDIALGLVGAVERFEPGVAGDSVPMRDFRTAVRGVTLPAKDVAATGSLAGDRVRTKASRRAEEAGEVGTEPTRRGVRGLFVLARKLELRAGVMGLPLGCLSKGIVDVGVCRSLGACGCSSMTRRDATVE